MEKKKWKRNCPNPNRNPNCKKVIFYSTKSHKVTAEKRNTNCLSCVKKGKKHSQETNKKKGRSGKNNSMYGKSIYDIWLKKYGKEDADQRQKRANEKNSKSSSGKNNPMYGKFGEDNPNFGSKRSEETRKNMSETKNGENNPMFGKKGKDNPNFGSKRSEETRKRISKSLKGKTRSEKTKLKMRLSTIKRGLKFPNHNPDACKIIDEYGKKQGFNFQHAENGGEKCIGGYFPDGVDERRKTIIEVDEQHHFNSDGKLKQKDIQRQNYLENLGYKIIRIKI